MEETKYEGNCNLRKFEQRFVGNSEQYRDRARAGIKKQGFT